MNTLKLAACAAWMVVCLGLNVSLAGAQSLPSPWTAGDVGNPALGGNAAYSSGVFDVDAAGTDIWGTADQFHFVYQAVSGDVDIRARVDSLTTADEWSKAGVMIRSSLAANAAHGYALVAAQRGVAFQRRQIGGGLSASTAGGVIVAPQWVRLVRSGTTVSAFSSPDGANWTAIATDTIQLGATAYVGIAVTSHNPDVRTTASVSKVTLAAATEGGGTGINHSSTDVGNPVIAGSTSLAAGKYTITAAGTGVSQDADQFRYVYWPVNGDVDVVARIESLVPEELRGAVAGLMIRESLTPGSRHAFVGGSLVKGIDLRFRRSPDVPSEYVDGEGNVPAWMRLVRRGSIFEAFRSIDGTSWARIGSATIDMSDTVYVGIAVTSQNSGIPATAVVSGLRLTGSTATPPSSNTPPAIILNSPANGAGFAVPASVLMTAAASDADGSVVAVDFYANSTLVGRDTTAPYAFTLGALAAGTYTLKAAATDDAGAVTVSGSVDIVVAGGGTNGPGTPSWTVAFTASPDHATLVSNYVLEVYAAGATPGVSRAVATSNLGKPAPASTGDITVDRSTFFQGLAAGNYIATVAAVGSAGVSRSSTVSVTR